VVVNDEEIAEEADEIAAPTPPTLMLARRALERALSRCKDQEKPRQHRRPIGHAAQLLSHPWKATREP
jgi:hypothetical protein